MHENESFMPSGYIQIREHLRRLLIWCPLVLYLFVGRILRHHDSPICYRIPLSETQRTRDPEEELFGRDKIAIYVYEAVERMARP
ncbi:hypothetical protein GWI33_005610 [Rhynchophorus ferrugineus]|uniref:Uncharacterized protein n=1 Tax=Rhynchophorus ferrugineus TaxID=354439 RepID=A0A834IJP1_RHYFE|nr:hypothetical protein GWI33_005610 [Rhynchophorus ferrugineus]